MHQRWEDPESQGPEISAAEKKWQTETELAGHLEARGTIKGTVTGGH